jgi:hypothetical protein
VSYFYNYTKDTKKTPKKTLATIGCVYSNCARRVEAPMSMLRLAAVTGFVTFLGCSCTLAAEPSASAPQAQPTFTQSLVLDGSLGLLYTDNALATHTGRIDAGYLVPFLRLTYGLKSADGWAYTIYARNTSESYTERTADNALATLGSTLSKTAGEITAGVNFDTKFFFDGFYAARSITAYDLSAFITQPHTFTDIGLLVVPRVTLGHRWADIAAVERSFIDAQLSFEKTITEQWSLLAGGRFRVYWFQTAVAGLVPVDYYPSASLGLKYDFGHDVTLTTSISFLARRSNVGTRNYDKLDVGPSVDFKYPLPLP